MAKKIVLLTGSPRRKGNTAQMADALAAALEEKGCRVVRFDTAFLPLGGCRDCRACYRGEGACAFGGDGFNDIARELETADSLVLAAPVYWYTFPAQIKHVIDRFVSLYNAKKFPAGIPAALITCCAEPAMDTFDGIVFAYRKTVSLLGCRNVGEVLIPGVYGAGEISQTDGLAQARALADKLSTSAGFVYTGERFEKYFSDFAAKYNFHDMYSGGFYPYATLEEHWAYWSRSIYINRYLNAPKPVYEKLLSLVKGKDSFVLTTNVDHCFQKAGFDKHRLFYTQGDYGLFQCSEPCCAETFDNGEIIQNMVTAQGYTIAPDGTLTAPEAPKMAVPTELVPHCPHCGRPLTTNLRCDDRFVQDEGWYAAAERYENFLRTRAGQRILFLELGVGYNTPGIIKYPFWRMTDGNPRAVYACLNAGDACAPDAIKNRSVCIDGDLADILAQI